MKLGVFGGTFDPIHIAHLHVAHRILRLFGLSQIQFVIAADPPHKSAREVVSLTHRHAMVSLATSGLASFVPSLVELEPPASPFSIHTLGKLARASRSRLDLYFIAGADSLLELASWRESEKLLSSYHVIFVGRPGVTAPDAATVLPPQAAPRVRDLRGLSSRQLERKIQEENKSPQNRIFLVNVGAPDISSSQIRNLASLGKRFRHLVPPPVHEYIRKLHIYGS